MKMDDTLDMTTGDNSTPRWEIMVPSPMIEYVCMIFNQAICVRVIDKTVVFL